MRRFRVGLALKTGAALAMGMLALASGPSAAQQGGKIKVDLRLVLASTSSRRTGMSPPSAIPS
jgi:hypothetical protein